MNSEDFPTGRAIKLSTSHQVVFVVAFGALAGALVLGVPLLEQSFAKKPEPSAAAAPPGTFRPTAQQWETLKFASVAEATFRSHFDTDGRIAADDYLTTQVYSQFSGRVTRVIAKVGDVVRRGAPLFAVAASEIVQGRSDIANAAAQLKQAERTATRIAALYKVEGAALKDVQQSQTDLLAAQTAYRAARDRLSVLGKSDAEIDSLERDAPTLKAPEETMVVAPIGGVITQRAVSVGQTIGSLANGGANPAFVVTNLSTVWLVGNLRETDAPLAQLGQPVEVHVLALPGETFNAKLNFIAASVDPASRRVTVRAEIKNPDGRLKPEMFASFTLVNSAETRSLSVPESAVVFEGQTAHLWVARPDKTLELRQIKTGRIDNGSIEVVSGLSAGEQIVASGSVFIDRAGQSG